MKKKSGFTLIEMIVVMAISAILLAIAAPLLSNAISAFFGAAQLNDAAWQSRLAMERMSHDIRGIPASLSISIANSNELSYVDSHGNSVDYTVSGNLLTLNGNTLANGVQSLNFNYYDVNGNSTSTIANMVYIGIILNIVENSTNQTVETVVAPRNLLI